MKFWYMLLALVALVTALPADSPVALEARVAEALPVAGNGGGCQSMLRGPSIHDDVEADVLE